jgi:acetyltransferase-like isoleucine patch superfamily enzyme
VHSVISPEARVAADVAVWHFVNILPGAKVGEGSSIGSYAEIGRNVALGKRCRVEAHVFIPEGVTVGDDVFIGPHACFTNDPNPPSPKEKWRPTVVEDGAAIGANATILPGVRIGKRALVAAGAVVTRDVPEGMMAAGVPAKVVGPRK